MPPVRLAEAPALSVADITGIALALARQVDALHRADVVHGHIRPSRVTLTGTDVELDPPDGVGFSKAHDVRSVGELTLWLLSRGGHRAAGPLAHVARAAAALDPASRPAAAQLVHELERVAASPDGDAVAPDPFRRPFPLKAGAITVLTVAAVAVAVAAWSRTRTAVDPAPSQRPPATAQASAPPRAAPLPAQVWPEAASACPHLSGGLAADLDRDGCDEELRIEGDRLAGVAGAVEVVGVTAAHHVTGDWNCLGTPTLATLDTTTGDVFLFPRWAQPGEEVEAVAIAQVPGATSLASGDIDGDGCDDLRAIGATGEVLIDVRPEAQQ